VRRENVLKNDDIITEIQVPASLFAARSTYLKFKERDSMDFRDGRRGRGCRAES
jgi:CO/xanthine dehydrogenase FAD-binding subunit